MQQSATFQDWYCIRIKGGTFDLIFTLGSMRSLAPIRLLLVELGITLASDIPVLIKYGGAISCEVGKGLKGMWEDLWFNSPGWAQFSIFQNLCMHDCREASVDIGVMRNESLGEVQIGGSIYDRINNPWFRSFHSVSLVNNTFLKIDSNFGQP